tara:strand:- start:657 stop:893 length:237 start_codon:yes stop_codon:yes gene_type:complete
MREVLIRVFRFPLLNTRSRLGVDNVSGHTSPPAGLEIVKDRVFTGDITFVIVIRWILPYLAVESNVWCGDIIRNSLFQ